jgi:regulatory protein YycH of two-component signal transduction system YycFG
MSSSGLGRISQFTCTSSLILLTHPEFQNEVKSVFKIDRIYNKSKQLVWKSTYQQNVDTIPMQTFIIVLQVPVAFGKIVKFCMDYNKGSSILDVKVIEKGKEIPEEYRVKPAIFPVDLSKLESGIEYTVPEEIINEVPNTKGIRKTIEYNDVSLKIFTNPYGDKVAKLAS